MAPKKAAANVEAAPLPGPSDEVDEEAEDTVTFAIEIQGVSNLPCELETKVAITGLCAELRSEPHAASASPSEFVLEKSKFTRRRAQQLYDDLASKELEVTLKNSVTFEVIGSVKISLLPLLHTQLEVGGTMNLDLTKLYQVRWLPEAAGADQEKLETLEPPPVDQIPKTTMSVVVRVESPAGPVEDREQWTTVSIALGGVFALPANFIGEGNVDAHPFTHSAMLLSESSGSGVLTQLGEAPPDTELDQEQRESFGYCVRFAECERRIVYRGSTFIQEWRSMLNKVGGAWLYFTSSEKPSSDPKKPNPPEVGELAKRFTGRAWVDLSPLIRAGTRSTGTVRCPLRSAAGVVSPPARPGVSGGFEPPASSGGPSTFEEAGTYIKVTVALSHDTKPAPSAFSQSALPDLLPPVGLMQFPSSKNAVTLYRDAVERSFCGVAEVLNTGTEPQGGIHASIDLLKKAGSYEEIKKDLRSALVQVCRERLRKDTSVIPGRPLEGAVRDEFMANAHSYLKGEMIDVIDSIRSRISDAVSSARPQSPSSPSKSMDGDGRRASFNDETDAFSQAIGEAALQGPTDLPDRTRAALKESEGAQKSRNTIGKVSDLGSRLERLAFEAELAGKWDRAATFLQSRLVLPEFKSDPSAWLAYGKLCARSRGRQMAAEEALRQAESFLPQSAAMLEGVGNEATMSVTQDVSVMLGALMMDRGRLAEARERLTALHQSDFGNPMYRFFLGLCFFLSDEGQSAKVLLESSGKSRDWFAGLSDAAAVEKKLKANPAAPNVAAYAAMIEKLLDFGLPQLVFTFLDQSNILSEEICNREPMAFLDARASALEMDYSAAIARLDRLIAGGQASREAYRLAGDCHYHLQSYDLAWNMMWEKSAQKNLEAWDAAFHARVGHVLIKKKRWVQARTHFTQSIKFQPTAEAWYGVAYAEYRSGEYEKCYEALCEAELLDNERPDVWAQLTLVHLRLENWENADRCFAQCLACNPDCDELLLEVSAEYVRRETKPALAEAAARCALNVRDSGYGHAALADALALSGHMEQAVAESQCAIRLLVDSPEQRKAIFERASRWCEELDPSFADELDKVRRQANEQFMQGLSSGDHH